ncbi:MAG TPA: sulfatase-like hydrolase/transferase [Thermoclostridium sp.]|nr:sulfatase-like hydrolase/transferase [Thermoclostridium sp.]
MKKKNILFLFADDMRYDTIAALGNPEIKTPNLDELVRSGTSFINAHIPGGSFAAVCMPSRAMLNTGRGLNHLVDRGHIIPEEHTCLGEHLRKNGYITFGTGKWHNDYKSYARSFTHGAEIFFGGMYDHWKVPVYNFDPTGEYPNVVHDVMDPGYDNLMVPRRCDHSHLGVHSTDLFADAACEFIRTYNSDKPFYMYVAYMAPHDPRSMPEEYLDMYNLDEISLPPNFYPEHPFDFGVREVRDEQLLKYPRDEKLVKENIRDYYAMISHLDASVGRIVKTLKESGMYDDTIIIFSADNGLAVGQHGLLGKQSAYEHSIRVPFVIAGPGIPRNETRDSYIYLMDIFPTLCDMLGLDIPSSVEGISFKSVIGNPEARTRDMLYAGYADKVRSIKDYTYKLIEYKCKDLRRTQLFKIDEDPWETNDLSKREDMQPIIHKLRAKLREHAEKWDDFNSDEGKRFWTEYLTVEPDEWGF